LKNAVKENKAEVMYMSLEQTTVIIVVEVISLPKRKDLDYYTS